MNAFRRAPLLASLAVVLLAVLLQPAVAQRDDLLSELNAEFNQDAERWSSALREVELYLEQQEHVRPDTEAYIHQTRSIWAEAERARDKIRADVDSLQRLLEALGDPPPPGGPAEPEVLRKRRNLYQQRLGELRARLARAELVMTRAEELESQLVELRLEQLRERLLTRLPVPWKPGVLIAAGREFADKLVILARAPSDWYRDLDPAERERVLHYPLMGALALAAIIGWMASRVLVRRYGRRRDIAEPTYRRRVLAAIVEGFGRGIIPALMIAGFFVWALNPPVDLSPLLRQVVVSLLFVLFFFVLAVSLPRAVLAPRFPQWQVLDVPDDTASLVSRGVSVLAGVLAVDIFFLSAARELQVSGQLRSVYFAVFSVVEGVGAIWLARDRFWVGPQSHEPEQPAAAAQGASPEHGQDEHGTEAGEEQEPFRLRFWRGIRRLVVLLAAAGIVAALSGYGVLGMFLVHNLLISALLIGLLAVLRGLLREGVGLISRSDALRRRFGMRERNLRRLRIWVMAVGEPLLAVLGALGVAALWGVPVDELLGTVREVMAGFTIGNVTIAPVDIVLAILAFVIVLTLLRVFRHRLLAPLLAETTLHESVQQSISTGAGYLGVVIAAALAIATLGIGLSNVALIAGALSVGIGFGLQNIVNNFVSGIILLMERPVKVGDWVVVGAFEGFVKEINIRATELETFQRASVIIPNADLISSSVINWTHKDRYGRVEVPVRVAYGTDPSQLRDILLDCARQHPMVVVHPVMMVLFMDFDENGMLFELRCFTRDVIWRLNIASELRYEIYRRLSEAGIEIPLPQRVVTVHGRGNLPGDDAAPGGDGHVPGSADGVDDGDGGGAPR